MDLLFISIFSALAIFYLFIGLYASQNINDNEDYFLASRDLGFFSLTFTLIATQLGSGMLLGTSQNAYEMGYLGILYISGMALGFLILGLGLASRLQTLKVSTTAELFETRYGSTFLKKVASFLSIITMCGLLIGQIVGSRDFIASFDLTNAASGEFIFLIFWVFIITYTILGGLKAVVLTDIFQVLFIIAIFGGIFIYALTLEPASFFTVSNLANVQSNFSIDYNQLINLLPTLYMPALFSLIEQDLAQRFFSARSKKVAAFSALSASIFILLFAAIPLYFGMKARLLGLPVGVDEIPLIPMLKLVSSRLVYALAICGIVAAVTSTADSLLCAISSNIAQDFDFSFARMKNSVQLSQIITLITGIAMFVCSYFFTSNIIEILVDSYEISVSALFVPLIICYFRKDLRTASAYGAISCGLLAFLFFKINPVFLSGIYTLGFSLLGYLIGHYSAGAPGKRVEQ